MDRDSSVHVDLEVDGGMGEFVRLPVNGQSATRDEEAATDTNSMTVGQLAELVVPTRSLSDALKTFTHTDTGDPESSDGCRVGRQEIGQPKGDWIDIQLFGEIIHPDFNCTPRVDRTVSSHRTARRLVGPDPRSGVVEGSDFIGSGVEHAVVVSGNMSEGGEGPTID